MEELKKYSVYVHTFPNGKNDRGIPKRSAKNGTQTRDEYISIYSLAH